MKQEEVLKYQIALTLLPGVGDVLAKALLSYFGSAEAVFAQKKEHLIKVPDIGPITANAILSHHVFKRAEEEVAYILHQGITPLFYTESIYPQRLRHCQDAPTMLYYKGNADLNNSKVIAVVGTRNATEYGKLACEQLVDELSAFNVLIVSGLAYGIDHSAHKSAIAHNTPTVAVLGHGLDSMYPATHRSMALKMQENGGLLTDFMSGTKASPENFPSRNRIVAGMVDAIVVVEAAEKGGALITAEIGNSYNREIFAIPGRVNDPYSVGCNALIKTNKAILAERAADIAYHLGWDLEGASVVPKQAKLLVSLTADEQQLVDILQQESAVAMDTLSLRSKMPVYKVATLLLDLEFNGVVKALPGKLFQLT